MIFCVEERYYSHWLEWILLDYGKIGFKFAIRPRFCYGVYKAILTFGGDLFADQRSLIFEGIRKNCLKPIGWILLEYGKSTFEYVIRSVQNLFFWLGGTCLVFV